MMPEEWPIAAQAADRNAPARHAGGDRLSTVRVDFFLDPAQRLTEQERALMTAMLHCLVGDIADELRAALPKGWAAANDEGNLALIEALTSAGLLDEPVLMTMLLRRADEERIATAARARSGRREARTLQGLVSHEVGAISAAAMALILARGRRRDRFGQCLIAFDDLPVSTAEALVHAIAAAMRVDLAAGHAAASADDELAAASRGVLGRHDPARGIDALTGALVRLLEEHGRLDDDLILSAAHEGEVGFIAEALGRRSGLASDTAIDVLLSANTERMMVLFRMAGMKRKLAAGLLAGVGDLLGLSDPGQAISVFDKVTDGQVNSARAWLASAPAYKAAVAALESDRG